MRGDEREHKQKNALMFTSRISSQLTAPPMALNVKGAQAVHARSADREATPACSVPGWQSVTGLHGSEFPASPYVTPSTQFVQTRLDVGVGAVDSPLPAVHVLTVLQVAWPLRSWYWVMPSHGLQEVWSATSLKVPTAHFVQARSVEGDASADS